MKDQFCTKQYSMLFLVVTSLLSSYCFSQEAVQVRFEPRHKPVFENEYVRILNVWLPPGDTTLYHIHSTPSLFNFYTDAKLSTQVRKGPWEISTPKAGFCWYRSFVNDTLIHRIINIDTVPCHVMDVELLSRYQPEEDATTTDSLPAAFHLLFDNERAYAWHATDPGFADHRISGRGPMIAEFLSGKDLRYQNNTTGKSVLLRAGMYLYIEPNTEFYFTATITSPLNIILFELK